MDRVLVVEDDKEEAEKVRRSLEKAGFQAEVCADGPSGLRQVLEHRPVLVVLDLSLPGMDGLELCRKLRADPRGRGIPVIMLTAMGGEPQRVAGLEAGADDYLTKPFSSHELAARARALLRRISRSEEAPPKKKKLAFPGLELDLEGHEVRVGRRSVALTPKEFKLLSLFCLHPGRLFGREEILAQVWGSRSDVETNTVDVHVQRLRSKLGPAAAMIRTLRGAGYRFRED
jgi:two-component system phosphate regulon response regulator PhoB